jgi:CHAT domain-containing protein/Flp pilus assembly protein TadD
MVAVMLRPYVELVDFSYVFCNDRLFWGISLYAGWCATAGFDVNVRMLAMNKAISIVMLACLSCLPMSIIIIESIQAQTTQDSKAEATRLLRQGNQLYQASRYREAIQTWQLALGIYRTIKDRKGEATILNNLGTAYESFGQYQKAIDFYQQSLAITTQISDRKGEAMALSNLGGAYDSLGQYQKAIEFYQQALAIQKQIGHRYGEATSLNNLGLAYNNIGQYQKAIEFYQQALAIQTQIDDREGESISLNNLGLASDNLGQYQKAIVFYQQALAIKKQIGDRNGEARSLNNLGAIYKNLGQYQKAIDFYQQSLAIKKQIGDRDGEATSLNNLGLVYDYLGQYQKAVDFYQQSVAIAKQIGESSIEARSLNNLGAAYDRLGQYQKAIDFYRQALEMQEKIGDRQGEAKSLNNLGIVYTNLRQYQRAINLHQQSLAIKKQIGDRQGEATSLNNLGFNFNQLGQTEISILFYKQSVNVFESIRQSLKELKEEEQQSFTNTIASSYRNLADLLLKQGRIMEALQVLDLLKVQELEDYFKNIKGSDRSAQGVRLLEAEKAISDKLLAVNFENSKEINSQLANKIQQLPKSEINKVPDYLQKIPQGTALLYPLILGDRLEIILFSPNTIPISRTVKIPQKELETLVTDFRAGLLDAGSEDVKEPAAQLYQLLIKPIEAELIQAKATTILYAPDGILRYIPIAALYDGKQWLAEKYRINNLIAYSLFDFFAQPKNSPKILAGAFGGKAGEKKFGQTALPATLKEVQAIANSFNNSVTLIEENFSRQAIESQFKNHSILHLATHAEFNIGVPDNSFIIFGNGDKIRLNEITDWQIPNIDLIVLSACQTGVGKLGDGVEILGFGYQVQKAGAKNAIASLWKVDDAGTQALMEAFYGELKKDDVTSTEALHRAQVALIKSPQYNHPNYWSAFFAIGNGL